LARIFLSIFLFGLAGCQPLALSLLGAGAGTALRYGIDGGAYRTFNASAPAVKQASLAALDRMGLTLDSTSSLEGSELIYARSANRTIEIGVEPISPRATRLRIAAKNGSIFYDNATASEIVAQTERLLDSAARGGTSANYF